MYTRMVIGEPISDLQLQELQTLFLEDLAPSIRQEPGLRSATMLVEDGGQMVVVLTDWDTRDSCLAYHASRPYRQFVEKTQHLLLGNLVVKVFRGL